MFFRVKTSGERQYLQLVENAWQQGRTRQRVLATLGRLDQLQQSGQLDALLASGARLAQRSLLLTAHREGQLPILTTCIIGPALIFERLWQVTGCRDVLSELLADRRFALILFLVCCRCFGGHAAEQRLERIEDKFRAW